MIARPVVFFIFILSGSRRMGGAYRSATQPLARFVFYPLQFAFAVAAAWRVFRQEAGPVRSCD